MEGGNCFCENRRLLLSSIIVVHINGLIIVGNIAFVEEERRNGLVIMCLYTCFVVVGGVCYYFCECVVVLMQNEVRSTDTSHVILFSSTV